MIAKIKALATRFLVFLAVSALYLTARAGAVAGADTLTLDQALRQAIEANPQIAVESDRARAEHSAVRSSYSLDNPKVGFMHEQNMNLMEQQMGPMNTWSVSQTFKFPTKYFLSGKIQTAKAQAADEAVAEKKLEVRQKLITAYYNFFVVDRIIELLKAQRATLGEIARSAESRHATGAVPQQDEMKAHVEQTKLDAKLIELDEEKTSAQAALNAVMGKPASEPIELPKDDIAVPKLERSLSEIAKIASEKSRILLEARYLSKAANQQKALAGWQYAPDFTVSYARAYGRDAPTDAYSLGVDISIPLWFIAKQSGDYSAAAARSAAAAKTEETYKLSTGSEVTSLASKVTSHAELLNIYETSLIPQATSTLNSSRGAYRAGRANFLELLDSERSLYAVRVAYYRTLAEYVDNLTRLEEISGATLSTLPMGDL